MAKVYPFAAYTPNAQNAPVISSLPYDVMNRAEARQVVANQPNSFLRVTLADLELPDEVSSYDTQVYERAAANWKLIKEQYLQQDAAPAYYVYSQVMNGRRQTGIVACADVHEYQSGIVRKHERTRQAKEDDRTKHIIATKAQTGPVFLAYRDIAALSTVMSETMANEQPLFDFTAEDGIRHSGWRIPVARNAEVAAAFEQAPILYIADGHHRAAAAARTAEQLAFAGDSGKTMAVIFPESALKILAYNRVVADLNGLTADAFIAKLAALGKVTENASKEPAGAGEVSFYLGGKWYGLAFNECHPEDPIANLDVSLLQEQVLAPMLDIQDPRTSQRIDFVGGIRGTEELERLVDSGSWAVAFSMYPTSLEQLMRVADANGIMPPKSTWFEPKLRDGLFVHEI